MKRAEARAARSRQLGLERIRSARGGRRVGAAVDYLRMTLARVEDPLVRRQVEDRVVEFLQVTAASVEPKSRKGARR